MREMSSWSIAASIFFSIAVMTSANEVVSGAVSLAGAGNPAAVEQSLADLVGRMGSAGQAIPKVMAEASGSAVRARFMAPERLQREKDFVLANGEVVTEPADLSGLFGLTDGRSGYSTKGLKWRDDNDQTQHYCDVGTDTTASLIVSYKPADSAYSINWLTDVSGKLIRTAYSDASGIRIVPNSTYSDRFTAELKYWDKIVPAATTGVASNASGS